MKRSGFVAAFLMGLGCQSLLAQTPTPIVPTPTYDQAVSSLEKGKAGYEEDSLLSALQALEPCANTLTADFNCCYQAARAHLYLSRCYDLDKRKDLAEKAIEKGIREAKQTVVLRADSADAHSLLALLYEAKLQHGDMFTGMDIGPKAGDENKKGLALDPANAQVQLALGIQYVMAPPIGGGDVKKGIATLQKVLELDPKMDEAYYWLAKAYRKQNDRENFKKSLDSALQLNPQNRMAQKELADWK